MPSCGTNCRLYFNIPSPAGAAISSQNQQNCQNCPNEVTFNNYPLCHECAQSGSVEHAYYHRYC